MNLIQILLIIVITTFSVLFITRTIGNIKKEKEEAIIEYTPEQHPIYPFIQYDIREALPPSRRTYMRYPYYASRYGMFMR